MKSDQETSLQNQETKIKEKLPWKVIVPFGLLLAGWSALWAVYNNFMPVFLQAYL